MKKNLLTHSDFKQYSAEYGIKGIDAFRALAQELNEYIVLLEPIYKRLESVQNIHYRVSTAKNNGEYTRFIANLRYVGTNKSGKDRFFHRVVNLGPVEKIGSLDKAEELAQEVCKERLKSIYREQSIVIPANEHLLELLKIYSPNGYKAMIAFERIIAID